MIPAHRHDCDRCRLLLVTPKADWYYCRASLGTRNGSVVARFGSDGPDYWSMPMDMVKASEGGTDFLRVARDTVMPMIERGDA